MPYLTDLVLKNEEVQKFPKDFVSASMRWIRSWFLEDDHVTKAIVESDKAPAVKVAVLEAKLTDLLKNPQFAQELQQQLAAYNTHCTRIKNIIDQGEIDARGNVHLGDESSTDATPYDEKNVMKGGFIKGNDVHIGDQSGG